MLAPLCCFLFLLCLNGSVQKEIRCAALCGKSFYQRIYSHLKEYLLRHTLHPRPLSFRPKRTASPPPHPPPLFEPQLTEAKAFELTMKRSSSFFFRLSDKQTFVKLAAETINPPEAWVPLSLVPTIPFLVKYSGPT